MNHLNPDQKNITVQIVDQPLPNPTINTVTRHAITNYGGGITGWLENGPDGRPSLATFQFDLNLRQGPTASGKGVVIASTFGNKRLSKIRSGLICHGPEIIQIVSWLHVKDADRDIVGPLPEFVTETQGGEW